MLLRNCKAGKYKVIPRIMFFLKNSIYTVAEGRILASDLLHIILNLVKLGVKPNMNSKTKSSSDRFSPKGLELISNLKSLGRFELELELNFKHIPEIQKAVT